MVMIAQPTEDDIEWIVSQRDNYANESSPFVDVRPDEEEARTLITKLRDNGIVLVARHQGKPVGFISGLKGVYPHDTTKTQVCGWHWWVDPVARSTGAAWDLMHTFLDVVRNVYGPGTLVTVGLQKGTRVNPRSLQRFGFALQEQVFMMRMA